MPIIFQEDLEGASGPHNLAIQEFHWVAQNRQSVICPTSVCRPSARKGWPNSKRDVAKV